MTRRGPLVGDRRMFRLPGRVAVLIAVVALVAAGCSGGGHSTATTSTSEAPLPAGKNPSKIAKMVCQPKAAKEIDEDLGVNATVIDQSWVDHRYSCVYQYATGSMSLSVQELSSWKQTYAFFNGLATQMGKVRDLQGLGQGAFQTTNGSVVVRKDWKVLLVNPALLPAQFGVPSSSSGDVAVSVGDVILGCWDGD